MPSRFSRGWRNRAPAAQLPTSTAIYDACRAELIGLGRLDTWQGWLLLVLAERMDREPSARGLVALSREFRRQLAVIGQATPPPGGPVDELRRRHRPTIYPFTATTSGAVAGGRMLRYPATALSRTWSPTPTVK